MIGALGAIPVAGAIQVVLLDWLEHRRQKILDPPGPLPPAVDAAVLSTAAAPEARGVARYRELFANDYAAALFVWSIVARLPTGMAALALVPARAR